VGLGLAIAGGLSQAIGASLNLRDTPGGGLTAELILPLFDHAGPTDQPAQLDRSDQVDIANAHQDDAALVTNVIQNVPSTLKAEL
jgi:hypothetical protein